MRLTSMAAILLLLPLLAHGEDSCDLARDVAKKGADAYGKDKAGGLKLFIKARELCSAEPVYVYNLGMAYYRYGHLDEAQPLLEEAIEKKGDKPDWKNNLALLILDRGGDAATALRHAEAAAAASYDEAVAETLARARMAAGKRLEALQGLHGLQTARGKSLPTEILKKAYADLVDVYIAHFLGLIKSGAAEEGVKGLTTADFEPKAQRAAALALLSTGRQSEALTFAGKAAERFPLDSALAKAQGEIAATVAAGLYREFQAGKGAQAVQKAKKLAVAYPLPALREAYDKLLEALLADASTIEVPQQLAQVRTESGGAAERLLAELGGGAAEAGLMDLKVDIDHDIPTGKATGKYDVAVVIGNRNYAAAGSPNVEYAERDARVMREYLIKTLGYDAKNILYEENATLSRFNELFGTERDPKGKLAKYVRDGVSKVFVYYVGHGAPDLDSSEAYFVPVDANPHYIKANGYRLQTFYDNLAKIPAKGMTIVLDSCFSGNSEKGILFKNISPAMVKVKKEVSGPVNAVVITSAAMDQVSSWYPEKRHSLFTYYFLKGLRGDADATGAGRVTVAAMRKYLQDNVPYMARRITGNEQQPVVTGGDDEVLAAVHN